jgi:membrane-associated phospholipid phosphatase
MSDTSTPDHTAHSTEQQALSHAPASPGSSFLTRAARPAAALDSGVDRLLHPLRRPLVLRAVEGFSHIGDAGAVWLITLSVLGRKDPKAALRAAAFLGIGTVIVNGPMKSLTKRSRPAPLDPEAFRPSGSSFPSGHSFSSWLVTMMLPTSSRLRLPAATVASAITTSRVFLRYHHTTDVLAGAALGAATGSLLRRLVSWR